LFLDKRSLNWVRVLRRPQSFQRGDLQSQVPD
jgi:hypothetical protein